MPLTASNYNQLSGVIWNVLTDEGFQCVNLPPNETSDRPVDRFGVVLDGDEPRLVLVEVSDAIESLLWSLKDED